MFALILKKAVIYWGMLTSKQWIHSDWVTAPNWRLTAESRRYKAAIYTADAGSNCMKFSSRTWTKVFRWKTSNQNTSRDFVLHLRFSLIVSSLSYFSLGKYMKKNEALSQKLSMWEKAPYFPHAKRIGRKLTCRTHFQRTEKYSLFIINWHISSCRVNT
jgi:hypothetical protein